MSGREGEKVACQHCGTPTHYLGTKCCDPCWTAGNVVRDRPDTVRKLLALQDAARKLPTAESLLLDGMRLAEGLRAAVQMIAPLGKDGPLLERIDRFLSVVRARYGIKE